MVATAKKISRTVVVGAVAAPFDVDDAFGGGLASTDPGYENLILTNMHATQIAAVAWNGVTAAVNGDDSRHILPLSYIVIPYRNTISLHASGAGTNVEVAGA